MRSADFARVRGRQIIGDMIHVIHVGVHGRAAAHIGASECLSGIGSVGVNQRIRRKPGDGVMRKSR